MMKQKKRVWMSFNLWEANVFEQYLEEMAAQGWFQRFKESVNSRKSVNRKFCDELLLRSEERRVGKECLS